MSDIFNVMSLTIQEPGGETLKQFRTKMSYNLVMEYIDKSGGVFQLKQWWSASQQMPVNVSEMLIFENEYDLA